MASTDYETSVIEEDLILGRNRAVPNLHFNAAKNPLVACLRASSDHSPLGDLARIPAELSIGSLLRVARTGQSRTASCFSLRASVLVQLAARHAIAALERCLNSEAKAS